MSGQAGARGYLMQALICVLDSLDPSHKWLSVTIEPNNESEKVDIAWGYCDQRKVVQVKSSQNQIDLASTRRWAAALEHSTKADAYELRLLGPCSAGVVGAKTIGKVLVPAPQAANLQSLLEQAAHKLDLYLSNQHPHRHLRPHARELIIRALSHRLGTFSTQGTSISRQEFNGLLGEWMREIITELPASERDSSAVDLDGYLRRFQDYFLQNLPSLVATNFKSDDSQCSSEDLLDFLSRGQHGQIVGPSGYGKSHLVRHMALHAAKCGRIPIIARGAEYTGNLTDILDRSVAAFCPCTATALLTTGFETGRSVVVVIDGLNECPVTMQERLLLDLQAVHLRWQATIVLTSQAVHELPPELAARVMTACELESSQRQRILQAYAQGELPADAESLCHPFRSAYELSVAATCLQEIAEHQNRAGLFDAYIRVRSHGRQDVVLLRRVLARIAGLMRTQLRSSLTIAEVERVGERALEHQQVSVTALESIIQAGFLDVHQGMCAFRHELLQQYFEAVDLVHSCRDVGCLIAELFKPAHHGLIEFVLGLEPDPERFLALLRATAGIRSSSGIISDCLRNRFGTAIGLAIQQDIKKLFQAAHRDLNQLSVVIETTEDDGRRQRSFEVQGQREWTPYESALWNTIANQFSQGFRLDESLQLVAETERVIVARVAELLGSEAVKKPGVLSLMFSDIFVLGSQRNRLPAAMLIQGAEWEWRNHEASVTTHRLAERCDMESETSHAALYLLLHSASAQNSMMESRLPVLLQRGWNSGIYHLQLEVLQYVQKWAHSQADQFSLSPEIRNAVEQLLSSFETRNVMLSSLLVETMSSFGLIELGITAEEVRSQLLVFLEQPDDSVARECAARAISNTFEDVYQNIYYEAIEGLTKEQRSKLFSMAALAIPSYSLSATYILEHLLQNPSVEAARAFERFSKEFDGESCCPQDTTRCFILAHQGSAIFRDTPWSLSDVESNDRKAWQCYGEIYFWSAKKELSAEEAKRKCGPLWDTLCRELRYAAIDPLMRFANATTCFGGDAKEHPVNQLFKVYRHQIRQLLEFGLAERESLTSIDTRIQGEYASRQRTVFLIHTLGQLGDLSTVQLLLPFAEDLEFGDVAVEAIRALHAERSFDSLKVLRRFP